MQRCISPGGGGFLVETSCGPPPIVDATEQTWNNSSTPGSTAVYSCKEGFSRTGGQNVSVCDEGGRWSAPSLLCTRTSDGSVTLHHQDEIIHEEDRKTLFLFPVPEILCGNPPLPPHSGQMWNGSSTPGSPVFYYCKKGFHHDEGTNMSLCTSNGSWTQPGISCKGKNVL